MIPFGNSHGSQTHQVGRLDLEESQPQRQPQALNEILAR